MSERDPPTSANEPTLVPTSPPTSALRLQSRPRRRPTPPQPLPARIGPYRILRLLGEGGMGAVYEAEQAFPHRTVALKVIRAGYASAT